MLSHQSNILDEVGTEYETRMHSVFIFMKTSSSISTVPLGPSIKGRSRWPVTMSSPENIREEYKHALEQHVPLIYGLPDDLAILCLSKVPRQFHHVLRCVSKRWSALLCSKEFSSCRSRQNLKETWIYAMCVNKYRVNCCYVLNPNPNPSSWHWKLLQRIPSECMGREGMSFEALGNKLFLLGGCGCQQNPTDEVYSYDTSTEKWEKAARMPTARCYFLSAAVGNKIYVTGGLGMSSDASKSWDIYDYHSNNWSSYQDTSIIPDIVKSFIFEGKVYTIHNTWIDRQYARVYDPSSRKWEEANQQMSSCARGPTVVIQDTLYMLDETYGTRLMMWQNEAKEWVPLGRLAQMLTKPPCQLVAVGSCIFIVGQKLSTVVVVVDTKKATQIEGILVGSSLVPKLDNDLSVISCKTVAI